MPAKPRTRHARAGASASTANGHASATDNGRRAARLEGLTALGATHALAVISGLGEGVKQPLHIWLQTGEKRRRLTVSRVGSVPETHTVAVLLGRGEWQSDLADTSLILEDADGAIALGPADVVHAQMPSELAAHLRAGLQEKQRAELLERILDQLARRGGALADAAPALSLLRDALREPLPLLDAGAEAECAARVEALWRIDRSCFYVEGWAIDRAGRLRSLRLLTPEGRRVEILHRAFRYSRPDVCEFFSVPASEKLGFIAHIQLPEESVPPSGWVLQAERADGGGFEVSAPATLDEPLNLRTTILNDLALDDPDEQALLGGHIAPAMSGLQRRLADAIEIEAVDQHGQPPSEPQVTIVVPLYIRTEFLEHQLAEFVHDPQIATSDLIYVLDSPEQAAHLRTLAGQLFDLYGVPFRLAVLNGNGGFSTVNNLGASLARGRMLLLLNSDVLPARPGWLSQMVDFYDANPKIGALAPKLLYEDDSIQHAGLRFERVAGAGAWSNEHYYKGLHRLFEEANIARAVPAVTGACLMIDTELYRSLGGLRGIYVRGDYEDSDLCLRLREQGRECWYLPEVELYHLEGQSYPTPERESASRYNQLLHSHLWRNSLVELESRD